MVVFFLEKNFLLRETPLGMGGLCLNASSGRKGTTIFDKICIYFISLTTKHGALCFVHGIYPPAIRIDQRLLDAGYGIREYLVHLLQREIEELTGQLYASFAFAFIYWEI